LKKLQYLDSPPHARKCYTLHSSNTGAILGVDCIFNMYDEHLSYKAFKKTEYIKINIKNE